MRPLRYILGLVLLIFSSLAHAQQDVDFYIADQYLQGIKIIKVYQNVSSPFVFALSDNNHIYRIDINAKTTTDISDEFAPYNSTLKFVDIVSPDDVEIFIATNTSTILDFKNNVINLIGASIGIRGNIRSIGYQAKGGAFQNFRPSLLIGTDVGLGVYFLDDLTLQFSVEPYPVDIFASDFRTCIYTYFKLENDPRLRGIIERFYLATSEAYVWDGPTFGATNTAFNDFPDLTFDYANEPDLVNTYWGSVNGLYESPLLQNSVISSIKQYLTGIRVNKIRNILGLTSFGNKYFRSNLLVGTNQGLYFSNSTISTNKSQVPLSFTHLDILGNININDIHTSITNVSHIYNLNDCENAVWLGTNNGLFCIKPDYAKYFNVKQVQAISFKNLPDTTSTVEICTSDSLIASINYNFIYGNSIQWFKDSLPITGATNQNLVIKQSGNYHAVLYNSCENIHEETNHLNVQLDAPVLTFNYPDTVRFCADSSIILTTADSASYQYRWYKNGTLTTDKTSSITVKNPGRYKVEVSSCPNIWISSKEVAAQIITIPQPHITSAKQVYCAEDTAFLSANVPTDPAYTIDWYNDGNLITSARNSPVLKITSSGNYYTIVKSNVSSCSEVATPDPITFIPPPVFTFNYPPDLQYCAGTPLTLSASFNSGYKYQWYKDGALLQDTTSGLAVAQSGSYQLQVSACAGSWVSTHPVNVKFIQLTAPVIASDKAAYCTGDLAKLTESAKPDTAYTINWYRDGILLPGFKDMQSVSTNVAGSYYVTLVSNSTNTDGTVCSQTSTSNALTFDAPPQVSIQEIVKTTLCDGQTVYLQANHTTGSVLWSTGETTDQITVTTPGIYTATVTSPAGCLVDTSISVNFLPVPSIHLNDTSICSYKKQVITLTAPPGFQTYAWNGQPGGQAYSVSSPQTITLTVTDVNGCQASQQIKIVDQCPNIYIPNTFTPNGDGVNDTWDIQGLSYDRTAHIQVFTRYGVLVYESHGYGNAWDGSLSGKKLPGGVYYYIITAKNNTERFSGPLTLIY